MKVAVLGQGYVGLTATVSLAAAGHEVVGIESDLGRLQALLAGRSPIYEPGLQDALTFASERNLARFAPSLAEAGRADALLIAVGSPELPSGGADVRQLAAAIKEVSEQPVLPSLVAVKSTVPPGTSEKILAEASPTLSLDARYAFSPEFLSQGQALQGWRTPSRVVVGLKNQELLPLLKDLYRGIEAPWVVTTLTNAEMIKYASNAFLATKISFVNEIANLCEDVGADIDHVVQGVGLDPRIGTAFMRAGVGYGGSCFPKDTRALAHLSSTRGKRMKLLEAVIEVNNDQRLHVVHRLARELCGVDDPVVAVLGLSFKPGTDDVREAPSLAVVPRLIERGYDVRIWDPAVDERTARQCFPGAALEADMSGALIGAHAALVLTEWPEVVSACWSELAGAMRAPRAVIDGRNCLDASLLEACGIAYRGVGRASLGRRDRAEPQTNLQP